MATKVFLDDRHYTYEGLVEQLNLIEMDFRDGGYKKCVSTPEKILRQARLLDTHLVDNSASECSCSPSKHMPAVLGLAKDGMRLSQNKSQRALFTAIRDDALKYKRRLEEGQLNEDEAFEYGNWINMVIDEMEKIRGEWGVCVINTEAYLDRVSGFAHEGIGFTDDEDEKRFMRNLGDTAKQHYYHVSSGKTNSKSAEAMREWAREQRRRVANKTWSGKLPESSRKDVEAGHKQEVSKKKVEKVSDDKPCPTCTIIPDKYKKKPGSEQDYRFVSVNVGGGQLGTMKVSSQRQNQDVRFIQR